MKKLMTILVVFALCGVAMAQKGGGSTVTGNSSAVKQIPLNNGTHDYINFVDETTQGQSALKYTVTGSRQLVTRYGWGYVNVDDGHNIGHVYFTTANQAYLDKFNATNNTNMTNVVVQFAGTQMDSGSNSLVQDYGIYLYDTASRQATDYYSVATGTNGQENVFELNPNQTFGVYYKELQADGTIKTITTTGNWIGNYDTGNSKQVDGANDITVYDDEHPDGYDTYTYKKFMCLLETIVYDNEITHWEFMLQTMLDNPYYNVNPEDFTGNGDTFNNDDAPNGQPLPGTLATLLIGGLCAGSLRKRNKK